MIPASNSYIGGQRLEIDLFSIGHISRINTSADNAVETQKQPHITPTIRAIVLTPLVGC